MDTTLTIAAYIWTGYCAVSHIQIEAKKKNEGLSFKEQKWGYIVQVLIYWMITAAII
jgi:hypothetical protein